MVEVWYHHKVVATHEAGTNIRIVSDADGDHLQVLDAKGKVIHTHKHGTWAAGNPASYHPQTGERLTGVHCASFEDDPDCPICHPQPASS